MASNIYKNKTTAQLIKIAVRHFHLFIRRRDHGQPCISCGSYNTSDASHYFSAGNHSVTRFEEDNVHLACRKCNYFLSGNLIPYRQNLIEKIGQERFDQLELLVNISKKTGFKWDRFSLIDIINKYKALNK
tara:strand:+ start:622 stop:1014 length:393 start_codon:yes stop_codon:yes gene_type:complete